MRLTRRGCLQTVSRGLAAGLLAGGSSAMAAPAGGSSAVAVPAAASAGSDYSAAGRTKLSMPGLFPGRVCAIENPSVIASGQYQAAQVQAMMRRGMVELTGAGDWQEAWRQFFEPGDVVGIKVNPVGAPRVISDATVLHEIVAGLKAAGVHRQDVVVYDRYRKQFLAAGMDKWIPEGVRMAHAVEDYKVVQGRRRSSFGSTKRSTSPPTP